MIGNGLLRHPLLRYFVLAFVISLGGILVILASRQFDLSPLQPLEGGLIFLAMLLGPSVSGLLCTALMDETAEIRELGRRALHWRVALRWYAVALLTMPALLLTILWLLSATIDPVFAPRFQWQLFAVGLIAATFEEIGWTGYATPRLLAQSNVGIAGLILGILWALWHLLVDFRYNVGAMGIAWPLEFAVVYLATLTPYRILMTWVYSHTQSLLLAILMHSSFTGWLLVMFPMTSFTQSLFWQSVLALTLGGAVVMVLRANPLRAARSTFPPSDRVMVPQNGGPP